MSTTHFNSSLVETKNFSSTVKQTRNFDSVLSYVRNYNASVSGFSQTNSWFARFVQFNEIQVGGITFFTTSEVNDVAQADGMVLEYAGIHEDQYLSGSIVQDNRINSVLSQSLEMGVANIHSFATMRLSLSDKLYYTSGISMVQTPFDISASMTAYKSYYVSDWDAFYLSDLDSYTLSAMEYQAV